MIVDSKEIQRKEFHTEQGKGDIMRKLSIVAVVILGIGFYFKTNQPGSVQDTKISSVEVKENTRKPSTKEIESHVHHDSHDHENHEEQPVQFSMPGNKVFSQSETGMGLAFVYDTLELTSEDAQILIDNKMEELQEDPEATIDEIVSAYEKLERAQFTSRYKLVYMMENLILPEASGVLSEIATAPIPNDLPEYEGDGTTDHEANEIMVRVRAIGGLELLHKSGSTETRETLYDIITSAKDQTIKNTAIRAWLSTSQDLENDQESLKQILSEDEHYMISTTEDQVEDHGVEFEIASK